jgi:uncharacterized membrane protein
MPFRDLIAAYSENLVKPTNTLCGQNAELAIVSGGGTYSYHYVLKGKANAEHNRLAKHCPSYKNFLHGIISALYKTQFNV